MKIELGDKVKCIHTGFTGIALSRTEFINGCVQYGILAKVGKDNKMPEEADIDEKSLKVISRKTKTKIKKGTRTGGAMRSSRPMKGY